MAKRLCVSVEGIDFLNPNRLQDGRECGARLELRIAEVDALPGSIYASRGLSISRGVCRFDLLESTPGAGDRMHWHPVMRDGEPGQRLFNDEMSRDPLRWLRLRLGASVALLKEGEVEDPDRFAPDAKILAGMADDIVADAAATLDRFRREPWPAVEARDERGMALTG